MKKLILLLSVSFFFRFLYLGVIPVSLSHDETDMIIQAHSVRHTGKDIEGTWNPSDFLPNSGVMGELAPVINLPALSVLPNNLFSAHFTTALLSSLFPLLIWYWLVLLKIKPNVAFTAAALLAVSPWHILFSRTSLEQPAALFFYVLGWIFLARLLARSTTIRAKVINTLLFGVFYTLGFFTYHGYKFSLPLLTSLIITWYYITPVYKHMRLLLIIPAICIVALLIRTSLLSTQYASRTDELILFNTQKYEQAVDLDRKQSLAPPVLRHLYSNKPLKLIQNIRDKYIATLDMDMLFLHGEAHGVFSIWQVGYLYLVTLPFLLIGLVYLVLTHKPEHLLILTLLVLSPIATVLHVNNSIAYRSAIYFVLLNIVTAYGLVYVYGLRHKLSDWSRKVLSILTLFLFLLSISYFSYIYFFVSPVTNANSYFFGDRLVANYIRLTPGSKTLLIASQPRYLNSAIVLANTEVTKKHIESFNSAYSPTDLDEYSYDNITISRSCPTDTSIKFDTIIVQINLLKDLTQCPALATLQLQPDLNISSLVSVQDSGEQYRILNDKLCQNIPLISYVHPTRLSDFKLEQMEATQFCQTWVVKQ